MPEDGSPAGPGTGAEGEPGTDSEPGPEPGAVGGGVPSALSNLIIVLDQPRDLVNIAGVARAMMNMGLSRLRLVRPAEFDENRIEGIAHQSRPVIERTAVLETLEEALADARFVLGTSARPRAALQNWVRPRQVAPELVRRAREGVVAVVFGREDKGLANEALDLCHEVAIIPTDPERPSLNLAQACLVLCYEVFLAAGGETDLPEGKKARVSPPATREEMERMYEALRQGLERIEFSKGRETGAVLRTLRTLLDRAEPNRREARLLQAIGFEIGHYLDRTRE